MIYNLLNFKNYLIRNQMGNDGEPMEKKSYSSVGFFKDNFYFEKENNGNYNFGFTKDTSNSFPKKEGSYNEYSFGKKDKGSIASGYFKENEAKIGKDFGMYISSGECYENRKSINGDDCLVF